jgi:hypothetical protein
MGSSVSQLPLSDDTRNFTWSLTGKKAIGEIREENVLYKQYNEAKQNYIFPYMKYIRTSHIFFFKGFKEP